MPKFVYKLERQPCEKSSRIKCKVISWCDLLAECCRLLDLISFQFIYPGRENFQRTSTTFWLNEPNVWRLQVRELHQGNPSPIHSSQWATSLTVPVQLPVSVCVSGTLIRSLLLCIGLQIREGAVNDVLMMCWSVDWLAVVLAGSRRGSLRMSTTSTATLNPSPHIFWPTHTHTHQATATKPTPFSPAFCYSIV